LDEQPSDSYPGYRWHGVDEERLNEAGPDSWIAIGGSAEAGASTRELMHRLGHSSMNAALLYQHATDRRARNIATRMDRQLKERQRKARKLIGGSTLDVA
jgi:hypothetical protein